MIRSVVATGCCLAASAALAQNLKKAESPSFSCAAAKAPVERVICADPTLAGLDLSLESVFRKALAARRDERRSVLDEQRRWLAERAGACDLAADGPATKSQSACLVDLYTARIAALAREETPALDIAPKRVRTMRIGPDGKVLAR